MSWGSELWDQPDNLNNHVARGIDFVETYGNFLKDRAAIETEYAKGLRSLTKKYGKKKLDDDQQFSYVKAFHGVLNETNDVAGQHETVADRLKMEVVTQIHDNVKELRELKRQNQEEIKVLQSNLDHQINIALGRAKADYVKAHKDARSADVKHNKADKDMNLSRAEVERARLNAIQKGQSAEKAKHTYALSLQTTNDNQKSHYQTLLPEKLENLRKLDSRRIAFLQEIIGMSVKIQKSTLPLLEKCLDEMLVNTGNISEQKDILHVIALYRSGYTPPQDLEFLTLDHNSFDIDDCAGVDSADIESYTSKGKNSKLGGTIRIKSFMRQKPGKRGGPPEPPQQKVNRLQTKLSAEQATLTKKRGERDGLSKLEKVYQQDPTQGDLGAVQRARQTTESDIAKLEAVIRSLEEQKLNAENELNTPIDIAVKDHTLSRKNKEKGSILRIPSISLGGSGRSSLRSSGHSNGLGSGDVSTANGHESARGDTSNRPPSECDSRSSTDTFDSGHFATPASQSNTPRGAADGSTPTGPLGAVKNGPPAFSVPPAPEAEYNTVPEDEILGRAVAEYSFDSQESGSENTISMATGDHFDILEPDDGDGWTRVRSTNGAEGFVPTAYLNIA